MPEVEHPVPAVNVLQTHSVMIPEIVGIDFRAVEYHVLTFGPPIKMEVLGSVANVSSRNKACVSVKGGRDVLRHELVGKPPANPVEYSFVILPEGVTNGWRSDGVAGTIGSVDRGYNVTSGVSRRDQTAKPRGPILAQAKAGIEPA